MYSYQQSSVHSGNYYRIGVQRVLAKLADMQIVVPKDVLTVPERRSGAVISFAAEYSRIEHAVMDWFEGRDYRQAQDLIHFRPPTSQWQTITPLDGCTPPGDISPGMLCPTRMDALAAVVASCDRDAVRLDACRKDGNALVVVINGGAAMLRIEPVVAEPFDRAVRDRVRAAFRGVRDGDEAAITAHAARLPGFKEALAPRRARSLPRATVADGCMFLGFPGNWALAMRNALKQVGIAVKQSQAQELAAVFFGASHWHQLIKHQDEVNEGNAPIAVDVEGKRRFYRTPEEALFATGKALEVFPEPVVVKSFGLAIGAKHCGAFSAARQSAVDAFPPLDWFLCPSSIATGSHDYWSAAAWDEGAAADAARRLLAAIDASDDIEASTLGVLYADTGNADTALLESLLGRAGIPPEQLVYIGDHALAVSYGPEPDGGPRLAAFLQAFRITSQGVRRHECGGVAMYKAETRVVRGIDGPKLVIRGDYGRDEPIVIPVASMSQVEQLVALTHREGLRTGDTVHFDEGTVPQLH